MILHNCNYYETKSQNCKIKSQNYEEKSRNYEEKINYELKIDIKKLK